MLPPLGEKVYEACQRADTYVATTLIQKKFEFHLKLSVEYSYISKEFCITSNMCQYCLNFM